MYAKQLIAISGLAMTFLAAPALAQSGTGADRDRQDRLGAASSAARQSDQASTAGNILTSLEGIWSVQVQVNRSHWDAMRGQQGTTTQPTQGERDNQRTNPTGDRQGQQRDNERQNQERNENEQQGRTDRAQNPGQTTGQIGAADGMARSHTILGGNILRTTVIFGADTGSTRGTTPSTDRQNPDRQERGNPQRDNERNHQREGQQREGAERDGISGTSSVDNSSMKSVSFLGYDQNTGHYNLALMTGQSGTIHSFTGKYDQSSRRIVFTSGSQPTSSSTADRDAGSRPSTTTGAGQGMSVVLQMEGNDRYTITAYQGSTSVGSLNENPGGSGADLGGQPAQRQGQERDADQRQDRAQGQATLAPNVIYKATYTKADNAQRSQFERMFDENERNERTATPSAR